MQGVALQSELRIVSGIVLRLKELFPHPGDLALDTVFHRDVKPGDAVVGPPADRVASGARRSDDTVCFLDRLLHLPLDASLRVENALHDGGVCSIRTDGAVACHRTLP